MAVRRRCRSEKPPSPEGVSTFCVAAKSTGAVAIEPIALTPLPPVDTGTSGVCFTGSADAPLSSHSPSSGTGDGMGCGFSYMTRILCSVRSGAPFSNNFPMSGLASFVGTLCTRNLSLQLFKSTGRSFCACMMTCTSCDAPGAMTPVLGRTQYFFGEVVFTLKATGVLLGFLTWSTAGICCRSSSRKVRWSLGSSSNVIVSLSSRERGGSFRDDG
mmetsp:Transcript_13342/g.43935  ORF Transcript_13342/g.43935 Transcript_13342/m.43935 type:complete len:215 (-) Transcript_13342:15-659(-)